MKIIKVIIFNIILMSYGLIFAVKEEGSQKELKKPLLTAPSQGTADASPLDQSVSTIDTSESTLDTSGSTNPSDESLVRGDIEEGGIRAQRPVQLSLLQRMRNKLFTKKNGLKAFETVVQGTICTLVNLLGSSNTPKIFAQHSFAESIAKNFDPQFGFIPELSCLSPEAMNNLRKTIAIAVKAGAALGVAYAWGQLDDYLYALGRPWTGFSAVALLALFKYVSQYFEHLQEDNCKPGLQKHRDDEHDRDPDGYRQIQLSPISHTLPSLTQSPRSPVLSGVRIGS